MCLGACATSLWTQASTTGILPSLLKISQDSEHLQQNFVDVQERFTKLQ